MSVLFVNAPNQIFYSALPLIEEKKFRKVKIITTDELAPFFKEHTKSEVIVPKVHPNLITSKNKHKIFFNIIRAKLEYKRIFKEIINDEIYVFFTSWSVVFFSFIKKLSKRNKIYFYLREGNYSPNFDDGSWTFKKERSIRAYIMTFFAKLFLDVDVFILNKSGLPVWELKRNSFPMQIIKYKPNLKLNKKYSTDHQLLNNKKILFLGQDLSFVVDDEKKIIDLTDNLFNVLESNFNDLFIIKSHPRDTKLYGKMSKSKAILPPQIMAETLMEHDWKYIIGYYSGSLISAKIKTNAIVISLMNLWDWNNPKLKQFWHNEFENNGIVMPNNLNEVKLLLKH